MLGINVADAVMIGTLALAILAAWRGSKAGTDSAKANPPPPPGMALLGGALVDTMNSEKIATALTKIGHEMELARLARAASEKSAFEEKLDMLLERLAEREAARPPRGR
jgi:hypothetical protein